ncbi:MAG: hypothetical protein M4D85_01205 [Actinomycetota bacterium]|nr:hypothetical protein [Actinomycetota bacterium]
MSIVLTAHDDVELDVHTVRDRTALVVNGELLWMNRQEVESLRHKLMLALRALDFGIAGVPGPRGS